jgi:signal transduction histidine kinase
MDQVITSRIDTLRKTQIFAKATDGFLEQIASKLQEIPLKNEETIFYKGEKGHAMYIIENGSVKVHDGDHVFAILEAGEVFGEYSLIDTEVRSATITGAEDTLLLSLDQEAFYELVNKDEQVLKGILHLMVGRLRRLDVIQEELAQKKNQIEKQSVEIEKQNDKLTILNEEKNHLISIVAHDIRNPLSSAATFANLLQSDSELLSEDHNEYVKYLLKSVNRMTDLVTRILDVKAIEDKSLSVRPSKFDIGAEMQEVVDMVQDKVEKKDLKLVAEIDNVTGVLDQGLFRQIIENLVSNAIKFSPEKKTIWLLLNHTEKLITVTVKDEGQGFSKEDMTKIFGKFQQLSAKPTGGESSTGLGLSIVKKFVDSLQGSITCDSEKGKGACFVVKLPLFDE